MILMYSCPSNNLICKYQLQSHVIWVVVLSSSLMLKKKKKIKWFTGHCKLALSTEWENGNYANRIFSSFFNSFRTSTWKSWLAKNQESIIYFSFSLQVLPSLMSQGPNFKPPHLLFKFSLEMMLLGCREATSRRVLEGEIFL